MGTEAIKLITGIGEPLLGRLMVYDALDMTYRTIKIRKDPATPKITELIDYEEFCGVVSEAAAEAAADSTITPRELRELLETAGFHDVERCAYREGRLHTSIEAVTALPTWRANRTCCTDRAAGD